MAMLAYKGPFRAICIGCSTDFDARAIARALDALQGSRAIGCCTRCAARAEARAHGSSELATLSGDRPPPELFSWD